MRRLVSLVFLCVALSSASASEPAPLRAALLAWEPVPLRADVQRVATELVALAQTELSAEPGLEWVERAELDRLLGETELSASGHLGPRASLHVGKLAGAHMLVTGRLNATDPKATTLVLEAIEVDRGDLLARIEAPLSPRPHMHYRMREEDRRAASPALRDLLSTATRRRAELADKTSLAMLFLSNTGPTTRLDDGARRIADQLRSSVEDARGRWLNFPRAADSADERDLALLGLVEGDLDSWKKVADLYAWIEYKETPTEGVAFDQTPAEATLTIWDGAAEPKTVLWRGGAADFPQAADVFSSAIVPALRKSSTRADTEATARAANLIRDRVSLLEKQQPEAARSLDFWKSELGLNFYRHRLNLLQTAAFFSPENPELAKQLFEAKWSDPLRHEDAASRWKKYFDRIALEHRFPTLPTHDPRRDTTSRAAFSMLCDAMRAQSKEHAKTLGAEELFRPLMESASKAWIREIEYKAAAYKPGFRDSALFHDLAFLASSRAFGAEFSRRLIKRSWSHFAPAFRAYHEKDPRTARDLARNLVRLFEEVGQEDVIFRMMAAAVEQSPPSTERGAQGISRPLKHRPDPAPVSPEWKDVDDASPISVRKLEWQPVSPEVRDFYASDPSGKKPRILGYDGHRLWLENPPLRHVVPAERARHRLAAFSPLSRSLDPVPAPSPLGAYISAAVATADHLYLGTGYEGLWKAETSAQGWRHITDRDGLPSSKIAGILPTKAGLVVATSSPDNVLARLDPQTGAWISIGAFPSNKEPRSPDRRMVPHHLPKETDDRPVAPRLAVSGDWLLACFDRPVIRNLRDPGIPDPIHALAAKRNADLRALAEKAARSPSAPLKLTLPPSWEITPPQTAVGDEISFWIGGEFGLVRLRPSRIEDDLLWEKERPVRALANFGKFLLVAFEPQAESGSYAGASDAKYVTPMGVLDKISARWVHEFTIHDAISDLVAGPGSAWAAGEHLHEIDLRQFDPAWKNRVRFPESDPAAAAFGLADQRVFEAVLKDDVTRLRALLAEPGAAFDDTRGLAPLHLATSTASREVFELLLARGANPNQFSADGRSPLSFAAARGDIDIVERLLAVGADPNGQGRPHNRRLLIDPAKPIPASATPPVQPSGGGAALLPDGRVRLTWQAPANSAERYSLYRKDPIDPYNEHLATRHGRTQVGGKDGWTDIGAQIDSNIPGDARTWIDTRRLPVRGSSTYTLIAESGADRYGPRAPAPLAILPELPRKPSDTRLVETPMPLVDTAPLHHAAWHGHAHIVRRLLDAGADASLTAAEGHGPPHFAALGGHGEIVLTLMKAGAPLELVATPAVSWRDNRELAKADTADLRRAGTVLQYVYFAHRDRALFEALLAVGGNAIGLERHAASLGREEDINLLRAARASSARQPLANEHPTFYHAYMAGRRDLARRLRDTDFGPNGENWSFAPDSGVSEETLTLAIQVDDPEMVRWLLERGAKPDDHSKNGHLERAITLHRTEIVRLLVDHGANPARLPDGLVAKIVDSELRAALKLSAPDSGFSYPWENGRSYGRSIRLTGRLAAPTPEELAADRALIQAASRNNLDGIRTALAAGAHVDAKDEKGWSPLMHALAGRHYEAMRTLIDAGATVNSVTHQGSSTLAFAVNTGERSIVEELLDFGADPELVNGTNSTPLHMALVDHPEIARYLVARGAHPDGLVHVGGLGEHAPVIFRLARAGKLDAIKLAVELGADPLCVLWRSHVGEPIRGLTALPYAAASNDVATLDYFIGLGLDLHWTNKHGYGALDWALHNNADRTAAKLRSLGVKAREERGLPPREE